MNLSSAAYKPATHRRQTTTPNTAHTHAAAEGDLSRCEALRHVYEAHIEHIYRFVYFKVGNQQDAEDITSQVFMKAGNSLDVTQGEQSQLSWLYQVARTTITDHWRNHYKKGAASLDLLEESAHFHPIAEPQLTVAEVESKAADKTAAILGMLSTNYRRVLELRFLEGCTLRETARRMQITEGNAKVLQHRALHKAGQLGAHLM